MSALKRPSLILLLLNTLIFWDEYLQWDVGGLHHPIILQRMFMHAAKKGMEGGREVYLLRPLMCPTKAKPGGRCTSCQASGVPNLPEGDLRPAHEVYLLRRLPGLPPCGPGQMEEAIKDIMYSLRSCLWR